MTVAIVVEDGTAKTNSNSYSSTGNADTYLGLRADTPATWGLADADTKAKALISASDYIDAWFRFLGSRVSATQAMSWPRSGVTDTVEQFDIPSNSVPAAVVRSAQVLASKIVDGVELIVDTDRGGLIKSATVGPISVTYEDGAPAGQVYGVANFLKGLLRTSDMQVEMSPFLGSNDKERLFEIGQNNYNPLGDATDDNP